MGLMSVHTSKKRITSADSVFQSNQICGKVRKFSRQNCINYQNHKNLVSRGIFVENILCFNVFIDSQKLCKQCNLDTFSFLRQSFCGFRKLRKPPLGCMTRNNVFEIFEWVKRAKNVDIHCGCFYPKCSKFLAVQNSSIGDLVTN